MLAVGIIVMHPTLHMPPLTRFVDGTGPIFAGKIFPFAFITIACGAISGFHALISSGTTPKLIRLETETRMVGYGAMLRGVDGGNHGHELRPASFNREFIFPSTARRELWGRCRKSRPGP